MSSVNVHMCMRLCSWLYQPQCTYIASPIPGQSVLAKCILQIGGVSYNMWQYRAYVMDSVKVAELL